MNKRNAKIPKSNMRILSLSSVNKPLIAANRIGNALLRAFVVAFLWRLYFLCTMLSYHLLHIHAYTRTHAPFHQQQQQKKNIDKKKQREMVSDASDKIKLSLMEILLERSYFYFALGQSSHGVKKIWGKCLTK